MKQHATGMTPQQQWPENFRRTPVPHARTVRQDLASVVTTGFGGKFLPVKMIPLLREDAISNTSVTINVQMAETASMLLNPVRVTATCHIVPKLAFERFQDMGTIDRSYNGIAEKDGLVVPWFQKHADGPIASNPIMKTLGLHGLDMNDFNTDYTEAYNAVWNYEARQRSDVLTQAAALNDQLLPAFWQHTQMRHVVPNFDDALMAGDVNVEITSGGKMPVKGIGTTLGTTPSGITGVRESDGTTTDYEFGYTVSSFPMKTQDGSSSAFPDIYTELAADGIQFSIADIDRARETAAWARLRQQYQGMSDDWMIDQMLQGIRLRDELLTQPILVGKSEASIGMSQRYATDSGNLEKSLTDGRTSLSVPVRSPALQCGGVAVICVQILPEQIYERRRDYYATAVNVSELPQRTRDELDPQPVELISMGEVDSSHSTPSDLFGYAPLNHKWIRNNPVIGGRYFREDPTDPWTEDRNRIWTADVPSPTLGPDFYTSETLSHDVFADSTVDPFEIWVAGSVPITGLTYFGPMLRESDGDYDAVAAQVDNTRLKGDGTDIIGGPAAEGNADEEA